MVVIKSLIIVTLILTIDCGPKAKTQKAKTEDKEDDKEQECLEQFFIKYCKEENEKILGDLEKCEQKFQPENLRLIELKCIKEVLNKTQDITDYKEIQMVECNDKLGKKFDECEQKGLNNLKQKGSLPKNLTKIAKETINCGFKCYNLACQVNI